MRVRRLGPFVVAALVWLAPAFAGAQPAAQNGQPGAAPVSSRLWLVAGGASTTMRSDCQNCEEDYPYRHGGSLLVNAGYRVNARMDVGAELFWIPMDSASGRIRTTHVDGVAQFRPWASRGFFLKGGAGMALVRNWVDAVGSDAINAKAMSVVIGMGWAFRPADRLGLQLFATQHAAALGELQTADALIPDVLGNFWSIGAAVVIR